MANKIKKKFIEDEIFSDISAEIDSDVSAEAALRSAADADLQAQIDALDSDYATDAELADLHTTISAEIDADVSAEEARALAAEGVLQSNIDAEEARALAAEGVNAAAIAAEEARALAAEGVNAAAIAAEETRALAAEGVNAAAIAAEETRALAAEGVNAAANAADIATLNGDSSVEGSVAKAIADVIDMAPEALNTLNELAASIGDDADFAGSVTQQITDAKNELKGTVSEAFDTMEEIEAEFAKLNGDSSVVGSIDNKVAAEQTRAETAEALLQADIQELQAVAWFNETVLHDGTDSLPSLAHEPVSGSLVLFAGRVALHEGVDYTISGKDVTFTGSVVVGGAEGLVSGEKIYAKYQK
jgi:hypothetical protein